MPPLPEYATEKTSGDPRAGALITIALDEPISNLDGYTLYLPVSHAERDGPLPILVYLQGAYRVGGRINDLNHWGLCRLVRDDNDLSLKRHQLMLDKFIVASLHIQDGSFDDQTEAVDGILDGIDANYGRDPDKIYVTGMSRGGHGSWSLASKIPEHLGAIAPVGGY